MARGRAAPPPPPRSALRGGQAGGRGGLRRHTLGQHAAAISYRVLFSLVPFMTLIAAILDLTLPDDTRENVINWVLDADPGHL